MKPHKASFINALTLISLGAWAYIDSNYAITALIPVIFGVIILVLNPGLKQENNKTAAHLVVFLTFLILGGLIKPLTGTMESGNNIGMLRVIIMMLTTAFALVTFVKSFISNRSK
jgi:hypothetical protein